MDQLSEWIPALTSTTLFAGAMWLARSVISTRLTNSIKNEFDSKLEVLRSELKQKEAQIDSLRSGAMSGLISRQGALFQRRLEAVDQIWSSTTSLQKAKHFSATLSTLRFEECAKESARNPDFRTALEAISGGLELPKLDLSGAASARPFVTPLAWAYYSAYHSVIVSAIVRMQALKNGLEEVDTLLNSEHTDKLLKAVFPSKASHIDALGPSTHHYFLDDIERLLLLELSSIQNGREVDRENAQRAAEITKAVEELATESTEIQVGPATAAE